MSSPVLHSPIIRLSRDNRGSDGNSGHAAPRRESAESIRTGPVIDDYANLQGESLLKKTLGYVGLWTSNSAKITCLSSPPLFALADHG